MYEKKRITILELSPNSLDIMLNGLAISKGVEYTREQKRVILDPYETTVTEASMFTDMFRLEEAKGMEDIYYVADIAKISISNIPGVSGNVVVNIVSGVRINHYLDKEFSFVYMETDTKSKTNAQEHFCGEYGGIPNIPYQHNINGVLGDIIATQCVFNN